MESDINTQPTHEVHSEPLLKHLPLQNDSDEISTESLNPTLEEEEAILKTPQ